MSQKYIERGWDYWEDKGIMVSPGRCGGRATVGASRIPVELCRNLHAEQIKEYWPCLSDQQVSDAVRYWKIRSSTLGRRESR